MTVDAFLTYDVDFLRDLLLYLETRQTSPRAIVMIEIEADSLELASNAQAFEGGLDVLLDLDYIEGPGFHSTGLWLFRKLTRKGTEFVRLSRDPVSWQKIKQRQSRRVNLGS